MRSGCSLDLLVHLLDGGLHIGRACGVEHGAFQGLLGSRGAQATLGVHAEGACHECGKAGVFEVAIDIATAQLNVGADQANARVALFIGSRGIDGKYAAHAAGLNVQLQTLNDKFNTLRQLGLNLLAAVAQIPQRLGTVDARAVGSVDTVKRRRRKVGRHFNNGCIDVRFFHYPRRSIMVAAIAGRFIVYRCRPSAPCSLRSQS